MGPVKNGYDPLGEPKHRLLVVVPVVPQLYETVETICAVPLSHLGAGVLERLRDRGDPVAVEPCPQGGDDRIDPLAWARLMYDLTTGEREPLPAAVVALEVTPGVERHKYPAVLYRGHELG